MFYPLRFLTYLMNMTIWIICVSKCKRQQYRHEQPRRDPTIIPQLRMHQDGIQQKEEEEEEEEETRKEREGQHDGNKSPRD